MWDLVTSILDIPRAVDSFLLYRAERQRVHDDEDRNIRHYPYGGKKGVNGAMHNDDNEQKHALGVEKGNDGRYPLCMSSGIPGFVAAREADAPRRRVRRTGSSVVLNPNLNRDTNKNLNRNGNGVQCLPSSHNGHKNAQPERQRRQQMRRKQQWQKQLERQPQQSKCHLEQYHHPNLQKRRRWPSLAAMDVARRHGSDDICLNSFSVPGCESVSVCVEEEKKTEMLEDGADRGDEVSPFLLRSSLPPAWVSPPIRTSSTVSSSSVTALTSTVISAHSSPTVRGGAIGDYLQSCASIPLCTVGDVATGGVDEEGRQRRRRDVSVESTPCPTCGRAGKEDEVSAVDTTAAELTGATTVVVSSVEAEVTNGLGAIHGSDKEGRENYLFNGMPKFRTCCRRLWKCLFVNFDRARMWHPFVVLFIVLLTIVFVLFGGLKFFQFFLGMPGVPAGGCIGQFLDIQGDGIADIVYHRWHGRRRKTPKLHFVAEPGPVPVHLQSLGFGRSGSSWLKLAASSPLRDLDVLRMAYSSDNPIDLVDRNIAEKGGGTTESGHHHRLSSVFIPPVIVRIYGDVWTAAGFGRGRGGGYDFGGVVAQDGLFPVVFHPGHVAERRAIFSQVEHEIYSHLRLSLPLSSSSSMLSSSSLSLLEEWYQRGAETDEEREALWALSCLYLYGGMYAGRHVEISPTAWSSSSAYSFVPIVEYLKRTSPSPSRHRLKRAYNTGGYSDGAGIKGNASDPSGPLMVSRKTVGGRAALARGYAVLSETIVDGKRVVDVSSSILAVTPRHPHLMVVLEGLLRSLVSTKTNATEKDFVNVTSNHLLRTEAGREKDNDKHRDEYETEDAHSHHRRHQRSQHRKSKEFEADEDVSVVDASARRKKRKTSAANVATKKKLKTETGKEGEINTVKKKGTTATGPGKGLGLNPRSASEPEAVPHSFRYHLGHALWLVVGGSVFARPVNKKPLGSSKENPWVLLRERCHVERAGERRDEEKRDEENTVVYVRTCDIVDENTCAKKVSERKPHRQGGGREESDEEYCLGALLGRSTRNVVETAEDVKRTREAREGGTGAISSFDGPGPGAFTIMGNDSRDAETDITRPSFPSADSGIAYIPASSFDSAVAVREASPSFSNHTVKVSRLDLMNERGVAPGWLCNRCLRSPLLGSPARCTSLCNEAALATLLCSNEHSLGHGVNENGITVPVHVLVNVTKLQDGMEMMPLQLTTKTTAAASRFPFPSPLVQWPKLIPRIIHQTWFEPLGEASYPNMIRLQNSWKATGWDYRFYDDEGARAFVTDHYPHRFLEAFDALVPGAFKADFFRYLVLLVSGGVYADIDVALDTTIEALIHPRMSFFVPLDKPGHVVDEPFCLWNGLMGAAPGHPFLVSVVERTVNLVRNRADLLDMEQDICHSRRGAKSRLASSENAVTENQKLKEQEERAQMLNLETWKTRSEPGLLLSGPCGLGVAVNEAMGRDPLSKFDVGWMHFGTKGSNVSHNDEWRSNPPLGGALILQQNHGRDGTMQFVDSERNVVVASTKLSFPHVEVQGKKGRLGKEKEFRVDGGNKRTKTNSRNKRNIRRKEKPHYSSANHHQWLFGSKMIYSDNYMANERMELVVRRTQ